MTMSQNVTATDFKGKEPVYITDSRAYANGQKDEWQVVTGKKYTVKKIELFVVVRKKE